MKQSDYQITVGAHGRKIITKDGWKRLRKDFPSKRHAVTALGINKYTLTMFEEAHGNPWPKDFTGADRRGDPGATPTWRETRAAVDRELIQTKKENVKLRRALDNITNIHTQKPRLITIPKPRKSGTEATACFLWSDWHVEEMVKPETINWLNEYNPAICENRVKKLCEGMVKLTDIERTGVKLDDAVIYLLGDFITGHIHDENKKTNTMQPTEAVVFAMGLIVSALDYTKKYGGFKRITVRCRPGNHSRTTERVEFATAGKNTFEWLLYQILADRYKNDPIINFEIRDANIDYCTIYDKVIRFMHGNEVRYGGGVGGVEIPIYKAVAQWDKARKADYTMFGHYHTAKAGENWILNGSLIGYNLFAESCKFSFQSPRQQMVLIDSKHGLQCVRPVFV